MHNDEPPEYVSQIEIGTLAGEIYKLKCSYCRRWTNHVAELSLRDNWNLDDDVLIGVSDYLMGRCQGCDMRSFWRITTDDESTYDERNASGEIVDRRQIFTTEQFPKVNTRFKSCKHFYSMPFEIRLAYEETYSALCNDLKKLGAAGTRLIIELVCISYDIKKGRLVTRIDGLLEKGLITESMSLLLNSVRVFGNNNLHSTQTATVDELELAWDAVNTLLESIYGAQDANKRYSTKDITF